MLPTGNGKFIVEDPTGGDGLEKLGDQFASLPRYEIDAVTLKDVARGMNIDVDKLRYALRNANIIRLCKNIE